MGSSVLGAAFFPLFTKAAAAAAAKETAQGDLGPEGIKIHRLDGHQWGIRKISFMAAGVQCLWNGKMVGFHGKIMDVFHQNEDFGVLTLFRRRQHWFIVMVMMGMFNLQKSDILPTKIMKLPTKPEYESVTI